MGHTLGKSSRSAARKRLKVSAESVNVGAVIIIASVVFLLVGAMLANVAAALSYLVGVPNDDDFVPYALRFVAFFPLMLSASMAAAFFGLWAVLLIPFGYFPSLMMVRKHNQQVQQVWDSVTVADFYEDSSRLV